MLSSDLTKPGSEANAPPPLIGALLRMPFEAVRDRMLAGLHERGYTDLVAAHLNVLQYPGPENQRPSALAARTRMSKQALNYLLGQLQQLGYLTRQDDVSDQRSKRIHLTPRGRAAIEAIREIVLEVEAEWEQQLGARKFAQLRDLLAQLHTIARPQTTPHRTGTATTTTRGYDHRSQQALRSPSGQAQESQHQQHR